MCRHYIAFLKKIATEKLIFNGLIQSYDVAGCSVVINSLGFVEFLKLKILIHEKVVRYGIRGRNSHSSAAKQGLCRA